MRGLKKLKEIQRLIGRITSLTRFLPRKDEKAKPIMNLLKRKKRFRWDQECEEDFQDLNLTPAKPPLLSKNSLGFSFVFNILIILYLHASIVILIGSLVSSTRSSSAFRVSMFPTSSCRNCQNQGYPIFTKIRVSVH